MSDDEPSNGTLVRLARLDERIKAVVRDIERAERDSGRAIKIASDELARRLDILNHSHENARETLTTYLPRAEAILEQDKVVQRLNALERAANERLNALERAAERLGGRLWLPMIAAAAIAAGLAATVVKMLVP